MKKIASIGFIFFFFFACEKNRDITTIEIIEPAPVELVGTMASGQIIGSPSDLGKNYSVRMYNALVQLIYKGEVLDETNTDGRGNYTFADQSIPEGAYVKASAPGFFPNIRKVTVENSDGYFNLVPDYFDLFTASSLEEGVEVVNIKGQLQPDNEGAGAYFYLVNENNELIGSFLSKNTLDFEITTIANTSVFLYHQNSPSCPLYGPVPLGLFTEDQDIGNVYPENNDAFKDQLVTVKGKAKDCKDTVLSSGGYYLVKYGNTTISYAPDQITSEESDRLFYAKQCELETAPEIIITAVNHEESLFGEYTLMYSGETLVENITIRTCVTDDTFLSFSLDEEFIDFNNFTTANFTSDGRVVVKQIAVNDDLIDGNIGFEFLSNGEPGTYEAKFILYLNSPSVGVITETQNLVVSVTSSDGEFMTGTISGEVFDAYRIPLGNLSGSFKARIQ